MQPKSPTTPDPGEHIVVYKNVGNSPLLWSGQWRDEELCNTENSLWNHHLTHLETHFLISGDFLCSQHTCARENPSQGRQGSEKGILMECNSMGKSWHPELTHPCSSPHIASCPTCFLKIHTEIMTEVSLQIATLKSLIEIHFSGCMEAM